MNYSNSHLTLSRLLSLFWLRSNSCFFLSILVSRLASSEAMLSSIVFVFDISPWNNSCKNHWANCDNDLLLPLVTWLHVQCHPNGTHKPFYQVLSKLWGSGISQEIIFDISQNGLFMISGFVSHLNSLNTFCSTSPGKIMLDQNMYLILMHNPQNKISGVVQCNHENNLLNQVIIE